MTYVFSYGAFLLGAVLYILGKVQEFKEMAEANPDPNVKFDLKEMLNKEWVNMARLLIGGVALIIFAPMLTGGSTVDIKNVSGQVVTTLAMETILLPFYFVTGYGGNSALFGYFGKYKKTLLNQQGVKE